MNLNVRQALAAVLSLAIILIFSVMSWPTNDPRLPGSAEVGFQAPAGQAPAGWAEPALNRREGFVPPEWCLHNDLVVICGPHHGNSWLIWSLAAIGLAGVLTQLIFHVRGHTKHDQAISEWQNHYLSWR